MASLVDLFRQDHRSAGPIGVDLSVADEICSDALIEHEYLAPTARGADILKGQITATRSGVEGLQLQRSLSPFWNFNDTGTPHRIQDVARHARPYCLPAITKKFDQSE